MCRSVRKSLYTGCSLEARHYYNVQLAMTTAANAPSPGDMCFLPLGLFLPQHTHATLVRVSKLCEMCTCRFVGGVSCVRSAGLVKGCLPAYKAGSLSQSACGQHCKLCSGVKRCLLYLCFQVLPLHTRQALVASSVVISTASHWSSHCSVGWAALKVAISTPPESFP